MYTFLPYLLQNRKNCFDFFAAAQVCKVPRRWNLAALFCCEYLVVVVSFFCCEWQKMKKSFYYCDGRGNAVVMLISANAKAKKGSQP
jgi:hypothetical protein